MNWEIGTYFKVIDQTSVYFGRIGRYTYFICGQMMIDFGDGDSRAYPENKLQWVA